MPDEKTLLSEGGGGASNVFTCQYRYYMHTGSLRRRDYMHTASLGRRDGLISALVTIKPEPLGKGLDAVVSADMSPSRRIQRCSMYFLVRISIKKLKNRTEQ